MSQGQPTYSIKKFFNTPTIFTAYSTTTLNPISDIIISTLTAYSSLGYENLVTHRSSNLPEFPCTSCI